MARSALEPFTVVLPVSELPESILCRFPHRPPADTRVAVTIEPAENEAEALAALRRDLCAALGDIAAGRVQNGADVFARLKARFPG
jgi:hypothetical protein